MIAATKDHWLVRAHRGLPQRQSEENESAAIGLEIHIHQDLKQALLETVIPRGPGKIVLQ